MLENFNREEALLTGNMSVNISSDIIEFIFWYLQKQEVTEQTVRGNVFCLDDTAFKSRERIRYKKTINFKEHIVNVKLKDISTWATEHLSKNWVTVRNKTLRKVS